MALLKYTTQISADKTVAEIQKCLSEHGASAILNEYDKEGYISSVSFQIKVKDQTVSFKLPSDWRPVLEIMEQDSKVPQRLCDQEQALRVSWRIVKSWIEAQMAILETKMVKMEQIFLPYAIGKDGRTVSEHFEEDSKFLLGNGTK